jgi:hypothetical protein
LQGILAEPPPQRRAADLGHEALGQHGPTEFTERPAGQGDAPVTGPFTRQGLDLDDDAGGESGLAARLEAAPQGRVSGGGQTACATC